MNIFVFGSSILSSYWNGAATYYRGIYKYLARRGHCITFAEPDAFGRQQHKDVGDFSFVESIVYRPTFDVDAMLQLASNADVVVKHGGIGVDDIELEASVAELSSQTTTVFWDVDSPATIARLRANPVDPFFLAIPRFDTIISYGGGPQSRAAYMSFGARTYCNIYNGLDPETHYPVEKDPELAYDLAFLGNRLPDRESRVEELFLGAAELAPQKKFLLGGEGWSDKILPPNVHWMGHVPTADHNRVNCSVRMIMNINRASMARCGFSPPTRVFEVAGAGTCMVCDHWPGIEECFEPGQEMLIVRDAADVVEILLHRTDAECAEIGRAFRARALRDHTYAQRAIQAEAAFQQCFERKGTASQKIESRR